jgi:hypothetical protein
MGLFDALFGGKKNQSSDDDLFNNLPDGTWLDGERNSSWRSIAKFSESQTIEFSPESCFSNTTGTFCVLRSFNSEANIVLFMGCLVLEGEDEFMMIVVDRHETQDGKVIKQDDWTRNRILSTEKIPSIESAITAARNNASFNDYSTVPPFVFWLSMKLGK